jgi:hypothetical protein
MVAVQRHHYSSHRINRAFFNASELGFGQWPARVSTAPHPAHYQTTTVFRRASSGRVQPRSNRSIEEVQEGVDRRFSPVFAQGREAIRAGDTAK